MNDAPITSVDQVAGAISDSSEPSGGDNNGGES